MIAELQVIKTQGGSKQENDKPVKDLQDEAADSNASVVLAGTDVSKSILDDGDEDCKQEVDTDMAMDKKCLKHQGQVHIERVWSILQAI